MTVLDEFPIADPTKADIALRLAEERIPISAIGRAIQVPSDTVCEALKWFIADGKLLSLPRYDWHPSPAGTRQIIETIRGYSDRELQMACVRVFNITPLQGAFLALFLRRNEVTKEHLHRIIEGQRRPSAEETTDVKMVDVIVCHLRRNLRVHGFVIKTIWAQGYYMLPEHRKAAQDMILSRSTDLEMMAEGETEFGTGDEVNGHETQTADLTEITSETGQEGEDLPPV